MKYAVIIVLVGGLMVSIFNAIYFVVMLLGAAYWTKGSYHQPVLTALQLYGGLCCLLMAILIIIGMVQGKGGAPGLAVFALFAAGAVAGLSLPFIHIFEVDVTPTGFPQATYRSGAPGSLRLYNTAKVPVRVCLGQHGVCGTGTGGPEALQGDGLTLQPGQNVKVATPTVGDYAITIADPAPGMTAIDAAVHVDPPADDDDGPPYYW